MKLVLLAALLVCLALLLWLVALWLGLGKCKDCDRLCPPWEVFCYRHNPHYQPADDESDGDSENNGPFDNRGRGR